MPEASKAVAYAHSKPGAPVSQWDPLEGHGRTFARFPGG